MSDARAMLERMREAFKGGLDWGFSDALFDERIQAALRELDRAYHDNCFGTGRFDPDGLVFQEMFSDITELEL